MVLMMQQNQRNNNFKFATPLTNGSLRVMLLGGGELGKEVVIALQRFGVETIVVDRYPNSPASQVAHKNHVIKMTDASLLIELINQEKPHLIVPEIEAIATEVLFEIEEKSIAQVIPNARAVNLTMNRVAIRTLASETLCLPTSKYMFAHTLDELKQAINYIGYPCFVKPVMSSSGKGQSKLKSAQDIEKSWNYALTAGRVNKVEVIVEECIEFDYEITLLTVRSLNSDGEIITSFCNPIGHLQVDGDYVESWQPHPMTEQALTNARHIAKTITDNLGGVGIFGVELFIKGDQVWFSEVSPRPHDTGMVTMITQYQNEFELHARAILGLPVNTTQKEIGASAVIYAGIDKPGIMFDGVAEALQVSNTDLRLFGKPEGFLKRRMGVALAFAADVETARVNAKLAASRVKPY